jgi:hypothetical protein
MEMVTQQSLQGASCLVIAGPDLSGRSKLVEGLRMTCRIVSGFMYDYIGVTS